MLVDYLPRGRAGGSAGGRSGRNGTTAAVAVAGACTLELNMAAVPCGGPRAAARMGNDPAELAASVERDGYCVVEGALGPAELQALQAAFAHHLAPEYEKFNAAGSVNVQNQRILGLPSNFLQLDDSFMQLVENPALLTVVTRLIGEDVQLQEMFSRCYPPEPPGPDAMGYVQWHHDHPTPGCHRWVKVQVLLSDVSENGGALAVVPGSHLAGQPRKGKAGTAPAFADYKSSRTPDGWRAEDEMAGMVKMAHRAGTMVVFDTHTWHTATANTSGVDRNSFFISYTPFWCRQTSRRRDCHFADALSPSLLIHLLKVGGGCSRMTVSSMAKADRPDRNDGAGTRG